MPVEEGIRDSYTVEYPPRPYGHGADQHRDRPYLVDIEGATPAGRGEIGQMVVRHCCRQRQEQQRCCRQPLGSILALNG